MSEELALIRAKYADADDKKLQIDGKEEMKESLGRSPDFADALMMRMLLELNPSIVDPIEMKRMQERKKTRRYLFF